jgi:hypothetical protein
LINRFGEPEEVFGPNRRFRAASAVLGAFLVLLGLVFFAAGGGAFQGAQPPGGLAYMWLGGGLMTVGVAAGVLPGRVPPTWVFVCSGGLVRARGAHWDDVDWAEVARFEDAALAGGAVAVRQCRIVLKGGGEWGFLADYIADYRRLADLLRRKVDEQDPPPDPPGSRTAEP